MDSSNSTNNKAPFDKNDWDNSVFDWENMKTGIFEKIESEDPDFFEKKRKRRPLVWFWFGILVLAGTVVVLTQIRNKNKKPSIGITPVVANEKTRDQGHDNSGMINHANSEEASNAATIEETSVKHYNVLTEVAVNNFNKNAGLGSNSTVRPNDSDKLNMGQALISKQASAKSNELYSKPIESIFLIDKPDTVVSEKVNRKHAFKLGFLSTISLKPVVFEGPILLKNTALLTSKDPSENLIKNTNRTARLAVSSGGLMSFSKYSGSSPAVDLRNKHTTPYFGYHFGIDYWKPIGKKDFLLMGMDAQFTYQNIDISTQRTVDTLLKNVLLNITSFAVGGLSSENYGDTLVTATENNRLVKYNAYRSLQTQLGYGRQFGSRKWHFTPFVGFAGKFAFNNNGITVAADKSLLYFDNRKPILRRFQLQAFGGIEIERCLTSKASLLLRYRFDKNLQNSSTEEKMSIFFGHHILSVGASVRLGNSL